MNQVITCLCVRGVCGHEAGVLKDCIVKFGDREKIRYNSLVFTYD